MAVMASEQPQAVSAEQKISNATSEKDEMIVDEPAPKAVNG